MAGQRLSQGYVHSVPSSKVMEVMKMLKFGSGREPYDRSQTIYDLANASCLVKEVYARRIVNYIYLLLLVHVCVSEKAYVCVQDRVTAETGGACRKLSSTTRRYVDIQSAAQGLIKVSIAFKSRTPLSDIFGDIEPSPLPTTSLLGEAPRFA
ncbi:unnamed protein product [Pieris brassicae]|uniref:Uncharacterized protein n=1 Tax=Pieris brassicae TaxID=7116 RepID=A0A9P0X812_PIEBR|nr:unnamed protein product [Pieris brassicae]